MHLQLLEVDKRSEFCRQGTCHRVISQVSTTTIQPTNDLQRQQATYNLQSPKSMDIHKPLIFKWTALNIYNHSSVECGKARKWWKVNWRLAHRNCRFLTLEIVGGNWPTKPQWSILLRSTTQDLLNLISAIEVLKKSLSIRMLCSKVETLTKR